jgi:hypothetical protein
MGSNVSHDSQLSLVVGLLDLLDLHNCLTSIFKNSAQEEINKCVLSIDRTT